MIIGVLKFELYIPGPNSLKSKRVVIKKIVATLRNKFNVSVSEVDHHDLWQRAVIGVSVVGAEKRFLNGVLDKIVDTVEGIHDVQILKYDLEFI